MTDKTVGDIAIVGGGVAGGYLGYCLAKRGIHATIFDDSHPREKPCGGGVPVHALRKFPLLKGVPGSYRITEKMLFISPAGRKSMFYGQTIMNVSRECLDKYLLQSAMDNGARLIEERVAGLEAEGDRWLVRTRKGEYRSRIVIGADGANSIVRKKLVGPIPREYMAVCAGYFARGVERDYIVIKLIEGYIGYAWIIPRETHSSIGVGVEFKRAGELNTLLDEFIEEYCPDIEKISHFGAMLPMIRDPAFYKIPCSGRNWILIGDAAGHVAPIHGEGIRYALWSAELAAEAVAEGEPAMFDTLCRKHYLWRFNYASRLIGFCYNPHVLELFVMAVPLTWPCGIFYMFAKRLYRSCKSLFNHVC